MQDRMRRDDIPMTARQEGHSHSPECPISCLEGLLSPRAYVPLSRDPSLTTIKDVLMLHQNGGLGDVRNIGELRAREIRAVLASIDSAIESSTRLPDLYLMLKLQVTSDIPYQKTRRSIWRATRFLTYSKIYISIPKMAPHSISTSRTSGG
jgi:hypothetical protein